MHLCALGISGRNGSSKYMLYMIGRITIETGSVESVCIICGMLRELTYVLTPLLFYDFLLSIILTGCDGCIESDSKSLSRWRREASRAYRKTRAKVVEENNYLRRSKKILSSFLGSTSKLKSSAWDHLTWKCTPWRKSMAKRRITPYQHNSNWSWNCSSCLAHWHEENGKPGHTNLFIFP